MTRSHFSRASRALRGAAFAALAILTLGACDDDIADPIVLDEQGSISGLLYFDVNRDGAFEPIEGDSALAGVPVWLQVRGTDQVVSGSETTTDAQGRFTITNVPVGTHDIVFESDALEGAIICNAPRQVSVRISEVTALSVSGQESCLIDIAEAREQPVGTPVTVRGVVTVGSGDLSASYFFIQDETAGVKVFTTANTEVGQFVEVSGTMDLFSGEIEVANAQITVLGTAPLPDPIELTGAEFVSHEYQGSLAVLRGLEVTAVEGSDAAGSSYNVRVTALDGSNFIVRVDSDAGITPGTFVVGNTYDLVGVVSPFGGAEQLYVRSQADITPL